MPERTIFQTGPGAAVLRRFSQKAGCTVDLIQHKDGSRCILRVYDHTVPAYSSLIGHEEPSLPQIFRCYDRDGLFHVEEEFVDGISLAELLETSRPDDAQACAIIRQVCHALSALHHHGFIHRDVKPENILMTSEGRVVLLDLDASTEEDHQKQQDTQLLGTVGYAAPEQFGFGRSNVRTDVFSVGVLLNVLCTGRHPAQHLTDGALQAIVERCIEVNTDKRYPSMDALLQQLPRTAEAAHCPHCGFLTPGGGCIHCGKPGSFQKKQRKRTLALFCLASIVAAGFLLAAFLRPAQEPENLPVSSAEAENALPTEPEESPEAHIPDPPGRPLTEEDIGEWCTPQMEDTLAAFELDGETYYLHPGSVGMDFPVSCSGISSMEHSQIVSYRISFWQKISDQPEEYREVTDPEVLQKIQNAFAEPESGQYGQPVSTLKLTMQAITTDGMPMPEEFPPLHPDVEHEPWRNALTAEFSEAHTGYWLITASGSINGQKLEAKTRFWWRVLKIHTIQPDPTLEIPVIQQINQALTEKGHDWIDAYEVLLPAGEYSGYIEIPNTLYDMVIYIRGSTDGQSVLHGGIHNDTSWCEVEQVHLIGAGMEQDAWPEDSDNFGRPNVAFYGAGSGRLNASTVEEYSCGMISTNGIRSGSDTYYHHNGIAIRFATESNNGGNNGMQNNRFTENAIGISFEKLHKEFPLSWFDLTGCEFQRNMLDIQNLLGQDLNTDGMIFYP